jgi:hypothetical protein
MDQFEKDNMQDTPKNESVTPEFKEQNPVAVQGHIKIFDPATKEVFVDKKNAIHYENFSYALAQSISNQGQGFISEMCFGNGGSRVDPTGIITYLTPNTSGINSTLYSQQYIKSVDKTNTFFNKDPGRNFMEVRHVTGTYYTDVLVSCLLDFGEPNGQSAFDNSTNLNGAFVFDELGLRAAGTDTSAQGTGRLLTHVIFHPVQKSLNRMIQIDYTVRIQSLTSGI